VLSFLRRPVDAGAQLAVVLNLTPVPRHGYRIGLPRAGRWEEALNTDAHLYGGSGCGNCGSVLAEERQMHSQPFSAVMTLPPLGVIVLRSPPAS
jgi:1,4-alpha-glucan branching enzyme